MNRFEYLLIRVASVICPILVEKGFKGRAGIKKLSVESIELFVELENTDTVVESLVKGSLSKTPKVNEVSIETLASLIDQFGAKEIPVKPIMKELLNFFSHSDGKVREQATELTVQLYRWLGPAVKTQIESLRGAQVKDLEQKFEKAEKGKAKRFLRSKQPKKETASTNSNDVEGEGVEDNQENVEEEEIDPYSLMEPVDILSKIPSDFFTLLKSKKWTERKQSIDSLISAASVPKIQNGDFNEIVKSLNLIISKDVNLQCSAAACKAVSLLVEGLRSEFSQHTKKLIEALVSKLKEKKPLILEPVHATLDGFLKYCIPLNEAWEFLVPSIQHKMPQVRKEMCDFLLRCLNYISLDDLQKSLKNLSNSSINLLNDSDPTVRDVAASILGMLVAIFGDRKMSPILQQLDKVKAKKVEESVPKDPPKRTLAPKEKSQPTKSAPSKENTRQTVSKDPPKPLEKTDPPKSSSEKTDPPKTSSDPKKTDPKPTTKVDPKKPETKPNNNSKPSSESSSKKNDSQKTESNPKSQESSKSSSHSSKAKEKDYGFQPIEDLDLHLEEHAPSENHEKSLFNENNEKSTRAKKHQSNFEWSFSKKYNELGKYFVAESSKHINEPLYAYMISPNDSKKHQKALELLDSFFKEASPQKIKLLLDNMDLILKWFTLRFFDTNINIFTLSLKALHSLFSLLVEKDQVSIPFFFQF